MAWVIVTAGNSCCARRFETFLSPPVLDPIRFCHLMGLISSNGTRMAVSAISSFP